MLVGIANFALAQFLQILGLFGFFAVVCVVFSVRLRFRRCKFDPIIDIVMVAVILIYAITLKINLST